MDAPPPLRTDGSNEFARFSMQVRVPRIARDVLDRNPGYAGLIRDSIERLAVDIENDALVPAPRAPSPDVADWSRAHADHARETWLAAEWFYAELAFYRELAHACRFWETGRDPFEPAKEEELASERPWERLNVALSRRGSREERILALLDDGLWGNRVDLSYTVAASRARAEGDLLVDERPMAVPRLSAPAAKVHVVADNIGAELALDLALVDAILEDSAARITLHVKMQPVFVSDAITRDVWRLVERMRQRGGDAGRLAERLVAGFEADRVALAPDPFWSGPRFLWEAPAHLRNELGSSTIVVLKGDANYRRLVGDAPWPPSAPLATAAGYVPVPLVCLRTMKSDPVLGLPAGLAERLDASEPRWRIDGQRGVVQMYVPRTAGN
jgi:hypothetical protein